MKKVVLFLILFLQISLVLLGSEYKVSLIGTEVFSNVDWTVRGINNKGQIFGGYHAYIGNSHKHLAFIFDPKKGFISIEPDEKNNIYSNELVLNNAGQLFGRGTMGAFMWSPSVGFRILDIFNSRVVQFLGLNDLGQVIGSYYVYPPNGTTRFFLWDNGVAYDMGNGSDFAKDFEALGYEVLDICLKSINNKGEIAGYFCYGKYHEKQKKYVPVGYKAFFWNGTPHIINLTSDIAHPEILKLNNLGVVLLISTVYDRCQDRAICTTYLWHMEEGLKTLTNFTGKTMNDSSIVLGYDDSNTIDGRPEPSIWKDDKCITLSELLGVSSLYDIAPPYSDTYSVERIEEVIDLNNKGQVACMGFLWGEKHPCILEPVKNDSSAKKD